MNEEIKDMKTILTRLFTVALLMMVSMGAWAEIKIDLGGKDNKGVYEGGTVTAKQSEAKDGKVTVTLTFTPDKNYSITRKDVLLAYTAPTNTSGNTRADNPTLGETFNPSGSDDVFAYPKSATYTVTVDANLGLSVQKVEFKNSRDSGAKAGGDEEPEDLGYSGTYYIRSGSSRKYPDGDYYLCPTEDWAFFYATDNVNSTNNGQPFLTTHIMDSGEEAKYRWIIEKYTIDEHDYYAFKYSIDYEDYSRYLSYNRKLSGNNVGVDRMRIHLEKTDSPGDYELFDITETTQNNKTYLVISPKKGDEDANNTKKYLVVNGGNTNSFKAYYINQGGVQKKENGPSGFTLTTGIIGTFNDIADGNAPFYLEDVVVRPTITINGSGQVEITAEAGTAIYCTTDGTKPTTTGTPYTTAFSIPAGATAIKAIAVNSDGVVSKVATLKLPAYTYNIVDTQGHIAIKYTVNQPAGLALSHNYTSIPEAIRSTYLEGEDITFYSTFTEGSRSNLFGEITSTPDEDGDIFVSYTTNHLNDKPLHLNASNPFKIQVKGEYVYDQNTSLMHSSTDGDDANNYRWLVKGGDPYRVQIQNVESSTHYFKWSTAPSASLTLGTSPSNFIIFGGRAAAPEGFKDQVELMAATGEDISSNTYYNVGRVSAVGLLPSNTYGHGNAAIQVLLKAEQRNVTFHIIDMSGRIVVEVSGPFDGLDVPEQWKSPLVQTYYYYKLENFRVTNGVYTLRLNQTEIDDFLNAPADIYVTYDPSDEYDLDGSENRTTDGKKYLLKFAGGTSFKQEKDDGFEATAAPGIYPYINGEGGLFVYGQDKLDATAGAVGSTRTRWAWYLEGGDPYRLRISTLQTRTDGNPDETLPRYSYLRTYMPKGYDKVVTGVISNNPIVYDDSDDAHAARHKPTEYMVLNGTNGHFKLVTSDVVDDGNTVRRRTVTSFENYWKTNRTAAQVIQDYYNDETVFKVNDTPTEEQIEAALTTGEGAIGWHSYDVWAYGSTWASPSKTFPESFRYGSHWFKTIDVGTKSESEGTFNGDFDLVEYHLDGALILLDQHGWEVMRKPITNRSSDKQAYAAELRMYDSPMVKKYHFWTNFIKEDGYHKYKPLRGNATASKNAQHKGVGTSLADYPEVFSTGTLADIYVTYEVMATYRDGYTGAATEAGTNFSNSKYLIRQGEKYAKTTDGSTIIPEDNVDLTAPSSIGDELLWYVKPNFNIDTEMGYKYSGIKGEKTQAETESAYYANRDATVYDTTNGQNGFDPYNLQIESVAQSGKLFTTNAIGAGLDNSGGLVSTYEGAKTVTLQSKTTVFDVTTNYYDSGTGYQIPHVTNSTFMAVSDANGNIRLMPRFDHHNVSTSFTALADQQDPAPYGDESGTQTTLFVLPSTSSPTPSGEPITISSSDEITDMNGYYILSEDFDVTKVVGTKAKPFKGTIDGQLYTIDGLSRPLVAYADGATIKNVIVKTVSINAGNADGNAGAICCQATGAARIYNCGILPTTTERDKDGNITGFSGSHVSGSANVGGIVGLLSGNARVINCFSYATITSGSTVAGIVGNIGYAANASITQDDVDLKPMVVNCMFYGDITGGSNIAPVYGGANGAMIKNETTKTVNNKAVGIGVNPYCYFRGGASFASSFTAINNYKRSWPAEEKYLTRFEYYRSILNSNRRLCTYWITNKAYGSETAPTEEDEALVAKWVLDPEIAPYPILKKWGKYPSIINPVPVNSLGTLSVSVDPGEHNNSAASKSITLTITDMDEANHDYGYYKVQLPYYNQLFGDPTSSDHAIRYGNNYTDMVVTGWEITEVTGGTDITNKSGTDADGVAYDHTFNADWESGYNFADRYCTDKDKFSVSGRVFAQGGYYYVPEGVTGITIKAHWGTAVYVRNAENSIDRVNVTNAVGSGSGFTPAGTLPNKFQGRTVYNSIQDAIKSNAFSNLEAGKTVYDQAVVLVGNVQVRNGSNVVNYSESNARPYTLMSTDLDFDNEPDFCLQLQFRNDLQRPRIQPVRFDFLSIPELGLAIRPDNKAWAIGIMVPAGHFEITETACMHTTQFEYDANISKVEGPVILNGGHFEQIVVRYGSTNNNGISDRTSYFIMGGHFWMKRFTPGAHTNTNSTPKIRHCAVNVIGGEFSEFYLSGIYRTIVSNKDNPHCYVNGGRFGTIAGAGMEQITGDITFKIDHAIIDEFYGGGINASLPVLGNIDVTIDNSRVGKYCGGPKVGILGTTSSYKSVTTHATGTTFGEYYGGGNGGTNYYREQKQDGDAAFPNNSASGWASYGYSTFNPLNTISSIAKVSDNSATNKGYHGEYEFEVFNNSNGTTDQAVVRAYYQWVQFGTTATGAVTNYLKDCTVNGNFYGGGNLGNVEGNVTTRLTGTTHITGSAFGAGYSAAIPTFRIHDKENATAANFPERDFAGVITEHTLDYKKDEFGQEIYYEWSNDLPPNTTSANAKDNPTFQKDGKWYCYTWTSLANLGTVNGVAEITVEGSSKVDGNVFGGGDSSGVTGDTFVIIKGNAEIGGDVFGGGNEGLVTGSATVNIEE